MDAGQSLKHGAFSDDSALWITMLCVHSSHARSLSQYLEVVAHWHDNVFYQHMFLTLAHGCASLLPRPPISCRNCFSPLNFPKWARSAMSLEKTSVEEMINTKPVYRLKTSAPPSSDPLEAAGGSSSSPSSQRRHISCCYAWSAASALTIY